MKIRAVVWGSSATARGKVRQLGIVRRCVSSSGADVTIVPAVLALFLLYNELVFECHQDDVEALKGLVKTEIESPADLKVPLIVDVGVGANWDGAR